MIDELAKAICCPYGCRSEKYGACASDFYEGSALAVLRRLREPTEAMKNAGTYEREINEGHAGQIWRTMIEAATGGEYPPNKNAPPA